MNIPNSLTTTRILMAPLLAVGITVLSGVDYASGYLRGRRLAVYERFATAA